MDQCSFAFRTIRQIWNDDRSLRTLNDVSLDRGDVSVVNFGASPTTSVDARALGRRGKKSNLSLYQARARAAALRERDIRIRHAQHPNLAYYRARAWTLGVRDD